MERINVQAQIRKEFGTNASRRMRRAGLIPAVVYGAKKPTLPVVVNPKDVLAILRSEAGHNTIFTLEVDGEGKSNVLLKDWQFEPADDRLLHVDFLRIAMDQRLIVKVPIRAVGEAKGVKVQGGILELVVREVELQCLPDDIPEHIDVDVSELVFGQNIRVADLKIDTSKVKVLTDSTQTVAHIISVKEEKPAEAEAVEAAAPAEPEVIKKGKAAAEGEAVAAEEGAEAEKK